MSQPRVETAREKRSRNMRAIRAFGTSPEKIVEAWLRKLRYHFETHDHQLPGRPDFVFQRRRKVILVHGDFWHGWQLPRWGTRLPKRYWQEKILRNKKRDRNNRRTLRRRGWDVLVLWEHEIVQRPTAAIGRIRSFLAS